MKKENKKFIDEKYCKILENLYDKKPEIFTDYKKEGEKYKRFSHLKTINYFYNVIIDTEKLKKIKGKKPIVGYFCALVPEELIIASGGIPIRLCNEDLHCAESGEEIIQGDICPLIKAICGSLSQNEINNFDLLVITGSCDGKVKLAEILSPVVKDIYFLDIPRNSDYKESIEIWEKAYSDFYEYLKKKFKTKPKRNDLIEVCKMTNERTRIFRKIYDLRGKKTGIMNSFDYFIMANASFFTSIEEWTDNAKKLYDEISKIEIKKNKYNKKILLAGPPIIFPNFKILEILEEVGCYVACDTMCSAYGHLYNPVEIDEETEKSVIRTLTLKYIAPSLCSCFIGIDKQINAILEFVEKYNLDGVVYYNLRLCNVFEIQIPVLRNILKEKGIPFLSLKTDLSKEDTGQLKTRIEAFIEMIG
ncbi:MAG TPA: 2-hydroxyacyl-CoA dehydratase family protein [bacterium]|nr:2-hydroxyacyl-CoA dehydratase family protein [bacterium]HOM26757.1 2-hydroxyacyl-CoA dehydratase family protein [bacterium]